MGRRKRPTVWIVQVSHDDPDEDYVLVFPNERMANKAVEYMNGKGFGDFQAQVFQEQFVENNWDAWKKDTDEYFEERYGEDDDG